MSWTWVILVIAWFCCSLCAAENDLFITVNATLDDPLTCVQDRECPLGQYCSLRSDEEPQLGICQSCDSYLHTYDYDQQTCVYCPIFRSKCLNGCCYAVDGHPGYEIRCIDGSCMRCHKTDVDSHYCTLQSYQDVSAKFIMAFGIVFAVAFTAIIIYRWSFRGRRGNFTDRRCSWQSGTSVSPMQQRTLELLQDRPPEYQTRHNYRHQQEMKAKERPTDPTLITMAPPPYPGMETTTDATTDSTQPPPYSRTEGTTEKTLHI